VISENENMNDTGSSELDVSYELSGYHFILNSEKYQVNCQKHNITFEEAATVIVDPHTEYYADDEHSDDEKFERKLQDLEPDERDIAIRLRKRRRHNPNVSVSVTNV